MNNDQVSKESKPALEISEAMLLYIENGKLLLNSRIYNKELMQKIKDSLKEVLEIGESPNTSYFK